MRAPGSGSGPALPRPRSPHHSRACHCLTQPRNSFVTRECTRCSGHLAAGSRCLVASWPRHGRRLDTASSLAACPGLGGESPCRVWSVSYSALRCGAKPAPLAWEPGATELPRVGETNRAGGAATASPPANSTGSLGC